MILAVESSTFRISCALLREDGSREEIQYSAARPDSSHLFTMLHHLLADSSAGLEEVTGFAIGAGPGSFTGLRIGFSAVRAFAMEQKKPVALVSAHAAIGAELAGLPGHLFVAQTARKGHVYLARYRENQMSGTIRYCSEDELLTELAAAASKEPVFVAGSYCSHLAEEAAEEQDFRVLANFQAPRALYVGELGRKMLADGKGVPGEEALPMYLRASEAEIKAGQGKNTEERRQEESP